MRVSHAASDVSAVFDEANLVSCAGLAPVVALGQRCGLAALVADKLTVANTGGVNAAVKVPALVAGMVAGADSIADMDLLRHGGLRRLFDGVRAPSTLGTFLRSVTFGHVRQLVSVRGGLPGPAGARDAAAAPAPARSLTSIRTTRRSDHGYASRASGSATRSSPPEPRAPADQIGGAWCCCGPTRRSPAPT